MKRILTKVLAVSSVFGFTMANAAIDVAAVGTKIDDASGQLEGFAPTILGFVLVMVVIGAFIKLIRRGA